jgi:hypothetical protein
MASFTTRSALCDRAAPPVAQSWRREQVAAMRDGAITKLLVTYLPSSFGGADVVVQRRNDHVDVLDADGEAVTEKSPEGYGNARFDFRWLAAKTPDSLGEAVAWSLFPFVSETGRPTDDDDRSGKARLVGSERTPLGVVNDYDVAIEVASWAVASHTRVTDRARLRGRMSLRAEGSELVSLSLRGPFTRSSEIDCADPDIVRPGTACPKPRVETRTMSVTVERTCAAPPPN